jgi:hypothetical protein
MANSLAVIVKKCLSKCLITKKNTVTKCIKEEKGNVKLFHKNLNMEYQMPP